MVWWFIILLLEKFGIYLRQERVNSIGSNENLSANSLKYSFIRKPWKNFRTAPYLIMHVHLTGDTLKNKAPYMDV